MKKINLDAVAKILCEAAAVGIIFLGLLALMPQIDILEWMVPEACLLVLAAGIYAVAFASRKDKVESMFMLVLCGFVATVFCLLFEVTSHQAMMKGFGIFSIAVIAVGSILLGYKCSSK